MYGIHIVIVSAIPHLAIIRKTDSFLIGEANMLVLTALPNHAYPIKENME